MTERIRQLLEQLLSKEYRGRRSDKEVDVSDIAASAESYMRRNSMRLARLLDEETPFLLANDTIGFNRTIRNVPSCSNERDIPYWPTGNTTPDYPYVLTRGIGGVLADIAAYKAKTDDAKKLDFYESCELALQAVLRLAARYREAAKEASPALYEALCTVPERPAKTLHEACVFLKIVCFALRLNYTFHVTLGRFDQYMYPYYLHDRQAGKTDEELLETLEEYFISINVDTDLYPGIQQGDNGQSIVLGGCDKEGKDAYNPLSYLCLQASLELSLIDPKINLRVNEKTPLSLYEKGTELTKQGLGFPQYCNDDVVIPGLVALGYDLQDARDYSVAACWEFLIPGKGMDVPNIRTVSFPHVVSDAVTDDLLQCATFDELFDSFEAHLESTLCRLLQEADAKVLEPSPYFSIFVTGCLEQGKDASEGAAKYNNYGFHGAGIANAADALAAVQEVVYRNKEVSKEELLAALRADFKGYEVLRNRLLDCPKMGNDEEEVDAIACRIMDAFVRHLQGKHNKYGGIIRPGTGSAADYIYEGERCPATPDGRGANQPFSANFSPAITTRLKGPFSVIRSFTKYDLKKIINGGQLTLEIHDTVFRDKDGIRKTAQLVKSYFEMGGHELQINSINRDVLLDAQKNPEKYPNLIVRVWGWSGYFNELDLVYQNHVISRTEFTM